MASFGNKQLKAVVVVKRCHGCKLSSGTDLTLLSSKLGHFNIAKCSRCLKHTKVVCDLLGCTNIAEHVIRFKSVVQKP